MNGIAQIIRDKRVNNYILSQIKKIRKNNINAPLLLIKVGNQIKNEYSFNLTIDGLFVKVDRKKNVEDIKNKLISMITNLIPHDIDIDLLFKIIVSNHEIIIRPKRYNR